MNLDAAVGIYISHRRAMGQKCESTAVALRAFCRRYGNKPLQGIMPLDVKQFLGYRKPGPQPGAGNIGYWETSSRTGSAAEN